MKTQTLGLLAILSLGVGLTSFSSASMFQESTDLDTYGESTAISGHVTLIHRDAQNNIIGYQQYDNIITKEGMECMTEVLFASTNSTACGAALSTDNFDKIGLLASGVTTEAEGTKFATFFTLSGGGLDATTATFSGNDVAADGATTTQGKVIAGISHTFTKTNSTAATIGGAILENDAEDAAFAAKNFSGGNIVLNESDTLQVTWTIQIGT